MNRRLAIRFLCAVCIYLTGSSIALAQHSETIDGERLLAEPTESTPDVERPVTASDDSPQLQRAVEIIRQRTNRFRDSKELPAVETNAELTDTARYFAKYMARTGTYGHTADGQTPSQRAVEYGYEYCLVSENIAYQFSTAELDPEELAKRFVEGWIESEDHRENMLADHVTEIGVAIARDDQSGYHFSVQMFGRPKSLSLEFSVRNESAQEVRYEVLADRKQTTYTLPPRAIITHTRCIPPRIQLGESTAESLEVKANASFVVRDEEGRLSLTETSDEAPEESPATPEF